jgi:two-component system sensor histidine kinase and response regulator WspE
VAGLGHRTSRRVASAQARAHLAWELRQLHRLAEDLGPQAQELAARLNKAKEEASELTRLNSVLDGEDAKDLQVLQGEVQSLRMVPLSVLFESYPRMVRELSKDLGKDVELTIEGENEQVDRSVLEVLSEPLLHLVRNAVDHGLETPDERAAAQKAPKGRLVLLAQREGDRLALSVQDDGKGMSAAALRAVAVKKGLLDQATADGLSDLAALDLVFLPGFSSKDTVSDVSGRGVGLDVVRQKLLGVGGEVTIETGLGRGSAFRLKVPISLALAPVLFVQVGDERVCLPASGVARAVHLEAGSLREVAGKAAVVLGDEVLPLGRLAPLLGLGPETPPKEGELALVLHGRGQTAAVLVDRVLEERVQAILPVRMILSSLPHLSGATQMADGALALVLSAAHLVGAVQGRERRLDAMLGASAERKKRLMVVDDSPLTRELLVSLLESAGYFILQAADGAEALERLSTEPVDCVVTDLEMPRVDGLELTRRVKAHPTLRSLPVVIVTTRGSDADRRRGMEAGADGYVAKGDLVRKDLADVLTRLLG